jgi:hypothetical protein
MPGPIAGRDCLPSRVEQRGLCDAMKSLEKREAEIGTFCIDTKGFRYD